MYLLKVFSRFRALFAFHRNGLRCASISFFVPSLIHSSSPHLAKYFNSQNTFVFFLLLPPFIASTSTSKIRTIRDLHCISLVLLDWIDCQVLNWCFHCSREYSRAEPFPYKEFLSLTQRPRASHLYISLRKGLFLRKLSTPTPGWHNLWGYRGS